MKKQIYKYPKAEMLYWYFSLFKILGGLLHVPGFPVVNDPKHLTPYLFRILSRYWCTPSDKLFVSRNEKFIQSALSHYDYCWDFKTPEKVEVVHVYKHADEVSDYDYVYNDVPEVLDDLPF